MSAEAPILARDMDLIRDILVWMECGAPRDSRPSPADELRFGYHCQLMVDAGLIEAMIYMVPGGRGSLPVPGRVIVKRLTWGGHEALEAMRSDTVWQAIKTKVAQHGLPMLLDLALSAAKGLAASKGFPMG